jgi:hypothetical protein
MMIIKDGEPENRGESINLVSIPDRFEVEIRIESVFFISIFYDGLSVKSIGSIVNSDYLTNQRYFMPKELINNNH